MRWRTGDTAPSALIAVSVAFVMGRNKRPALTTSSGTYFKGEKLAGVRILLYWLTIIAWALGRNA